MHSLANKVIFRTSYLQELSESSLVAPLGLGSVDLLAPP